jgi:hypothetical protein
MGETMNNNMMIRDNDGNTYITLAQWIEQHNVNNDNARAIRRYARNAHDDNKTFDNVNVTMDNGTTSTLRDVTSKYGRNWIIRNDVGNIDIATSNKRQRIPHTQRYVLYIDNNAIEQTLDALNAMDNVHVYDSRNNVFVVGG